MSPVLRPSRSDALAGLRVLDFSIMLAGPYCARLCADMGAEVLKIEPPEGDDMRQRAPLREGRAAGDIAMRQRIRRRRRPAAVLARRR